MENDIRGRLRRASLDRIALLTCLALFATLASPLAAARAMKPLEIKQRYLQVLEILAQGDLESAVEELVELETAAVGEQRAWRFVETLWRSKLHVLRDLLASQRVDLLMPVIVLHHDAYFRYSKAGRRHLAQHARTMSAELADLYAKRAGTPAAMAFAGSALNSFAAYLWSPSNIGMSAELFLRASLIDPGNELALQGLAAAWERSGDYDRAIETLIRALRVKPGDPELRLRWALCQLRNPEGLHERALEQLSLLAQRPGEEWIRSVAYQELARAQLAAEGAGRAETTLREGLEALAGDQQLSLQLASILDAQRRRSEALAVLDAIEIGGWKRESARQTYDFWEPPDLTQIRADLHRQMAGGTEPLAASLRSTPARGGPS